MPNAATGEIKRAAPGDRPGLLDAYWQAFGFSASRSDIYIDQVGLENFRTLHVDGELAAVAAVLDTAHWLGGRPVSAVNIAHVAINPAWRGAGLAGHFLESICAEATASGAGLATLFASTRPVYRRAGFALAGLETIYEAETSALPRSKTARFEHLRSPAVEQALLPLYDRHCASDAGLLQRNPAHWAALLAGDVSAYASTADDAPGYVVIDTTDSQCLVVRDWVALNGQAATNILSFLGTFASVYPCIRWHGAPQDALVFAMPDKGWRMVHQEEWLARVLDPTMALAQRGYRGTGKLTFELISAQSSQYITLDVQDGLGTCIPSGGDAPTIRMALADFGTVLTGHRSARFLARAGTLSAEPAAIALCDFLLAGPAPWVGEHF